MQEKRADAKILFKDLPKTYLIKSNFSDLPKWDNENYFKVLNLFQNNCKIDKVKNLYPSLCIKAKSVINAKEFFEENFSPFKIYTKKEKGKGLLTGYYEPQLNASLSKKGKYQYPIYKTPKDLIVVDLSSIYPKLKNYRLRGRLQGNKLIPYYTRKESNSKHLNADVLCYCTSKLDRFFLEVQGSGRVQLDNGKKIFIGYANQNGHKYRSIGKYLINHKKIKRKNVSLQAIKKYLKNNPSQLDKVLNYNKSVVYFKEKKSPASGALGIILTSKRSIAVDRRYIPLGSMLYLSADDNKTSYNKIVLAQDTGGAIKGAIRADMFLGYGKDAMQVAGELKAPLKLWILLPKSKKELISEDL